MDYVFLPLPRLWIGREGGGKEGRQQGRRKGIWHKFTQGNNSSHLRFPFFCCFATLLYTLRPHMRSQCCAGARYQHNPVQVMKLAPLPAPKESPPTCGGVSPPTKPTASFPLPDPPSERSTFHTELHKQPNANREPRLMTHHHPAQLGHNNNNPSSRTL